MVCFTVMNVRTIITADVFLPDYPSNVLVIHNEQHFIEIINSAKREDKHVHLIGERKPTIFGDHIDPHLPLHVDSKKVMEAMLLVLMDKRVVTDAVFIHGSSVVNTALDKKVLALAVTLKQQHETHHIVINGLPEAVCQDKNIAYPGYEVWMQELESLGDHEVLSIEGALHTALEANISFLKAIYHLTHTAQKVVRKSNNSNRLPPFSKC